MTMPRRDVSMLVHAALCMVCVGAAYISWSAPALLEQPVRVTQIVADRGPLVRVAWHDGGANVTLERTADGTRVIVQAQGGAPGQSYPRRNYPGTQAASALLERLRGLPAARALGPLDANQRHNFGLEPPLSTLDIEDEAGPQRVAIGEAVYGGSDLYALGPKGDGFVLRASSVAGLGHGAITLQDREIVGIAPEHVVGVQLEVGAHTRALVQQRRQEGARAYFADAAAPEHKLEQLTTLIERLLRLRMVELLDERPGGEPALVLRILGEPGPHEELGRIALYNTPQGPVALASRFDAPVLLQRLSAEAVLSDAEAAVDEGR